MGKTTIEWCDRVWNPVTGCTKISTGCEHCYAEALAKRFWGKRGFDQVQWHEGRLNDPLKWKKPQRIFVDSMGDLFHPALRDRYIDAAFEVMRMATQHTFMILTKRAHRMCAYMHNYPRTPASNIWLGVSVEDQETVNKRYGDLLDTPAAHRFISYEPALGPIHLMGSFQVSDTWSQAPMRSGMVDWVICGCESGPGKRPFNPGWAQLLRDQCVTAGVPFFLKSMPVNGKVVKLPELDGQVWAQFPK